MLDELLEPVAFGADLLQVKEELRCAEFSDVEPRVFDRGEANHVFGGLAVFTVEHHKIKK